MIPPDTSTLCTYAVFVSGGIMRSPSPAGGRRGERRLPGPLPRVTMAFAISAHPRPRREIVTVLRSSAASA